ncbi:MAG: helix-turn-helix transcriptional regulator [Muribaculaceae bacterium]|nr:helix-turn-helix transcriptional regulator [Muribaculaceae bacterium]
MVQVKVFICRESDGSYSCYVDDKAPINYGLVGEGPTVADAISDWNGTYEAMKQGYAEDGREFIEAEFSFAYDVPSFLAYYGGLITFKGLAKLTGISAAQLSQYANGYRNPSPKTTAKIQAGLRSFANELSQVALI